MSYGINLIFQKNKIGLGKRKHAIARVFFTSGNGNLLINNVSGDTYLQYNRTYTNLVKAPLKTLGLDKEFDIIVKVKGGGLKGQAEAIQLGVARLLCKISIKNRPQLKKEGYLTRDARIKERKKYGLRKARKAPQYSKR